MGLCSTAVTRRRSGPAPSCGAGRRPCGRGAGDRIGDACTAARFEPFFRYLPYLSTAEKAAAVHLGIFPENASARVGQPTVATAQASPPPPRPRRSSRHRSRSRRWSRRTGRPRHRRLLTCRRRVAPRRRIPLRRPPLPSRNGPPGPAVNSPKMSRLRLHPRRKPLSRSTIKAGRGQGHLSGIDKLLATMAEAPPPPQPKVEKGPTKAEKDRGGEESGGEEKAGREARSREESEGRGGEARRGPVPIGSSLPAGRIRTGWLWNISGCRPRQAGC